MYPLTHFNQAKRVPRREKNIFFFFQPKEANFDGRSEMRRTTHIHTHVAHAACVSIYTTTLVWCTISKWHMNNKNNKTIQQTVSCEMEYKHNFAYAALQLQCGVCVNYLLPIFLIIYLLEPTDCVFSYLFIFVSVHFRENFPIRHKTIAWEISSSSSSVSSPSLSYFTAQLSGIWNAMFFNLMQSVSKEM